MSDYCDTCFAYELGLGLKFTEYLSIRSSYVDSFSLDYDVYDEYDDSLTIQETTWRITLPKSGFFLEFGSGEIETDYYEYNWNGNYYSSNQDVDVLGIGLSSHSNGVSGGWKFKSYSPVSSSGDTITYASAFIEFHF